MSARNKAPPLAIRFFHTLCDVAVPAAVRGSLRQWWAEEKREWDECEKELVSSSHTYRCLLEQERITRDMIGGRSGNSVLTDLRRIWEAGKAETKVSEPGPPTNE